jgi:arylsulfatase A-like enzyme
MIKDFQKQLFVICLIFLSSIQCFSQEKPNVLMIVLDDLNNYVGVMGGHPQAKTPNIDKLAGEGILFSNAHSNVPICMPSRASFMNGISPITSGTWGFNNWLKNETLINSKSLPEYVKENGYKAYQTGKVFHNTKKGVWTEMGAIPDYGPMAYNGKKAALHPSCPAAMGVLGPLDATFA